MRVLQGFLVYGNKTEPWSFNLLSELHKHTKETVVIATNYKKSKFYSKEFKYLKFWFQNTSKMSRYLSRILFHKLIFGKVKKENIELIHAHFGPAGWRYKKLAKKLEVPLVVSFYGKDYEYIPHNKPVWKKRYDELFNIVDYFICEGKHGKNLLIEKGCPENKVAVCHLGIVPSEIAYHNRVKRPGSLHLVQIASFVEKKGHIYTVKAFHKALQESKASDLKLTLIGGKHDTYEEVNAYIEENQLGSSIEYISFIEYSKLYSFLKNFHVFIHPSCYSENMDCEGGAPVVLLDAQATGMPVIASFHCDIPDEVVHGQTGLLSKEKDVDGITESILRFLEMEQEEYDTFSKAARKHIEQEYDISKSAFKLYEIYKKILS